MRVLLILSGIFLLTTLPYDVASAAISHTISQSLPKSLAKLALRPSFKEDLHQEVTIYQKNILNPPILIQAKILEVENFRKKQIQLTKNSDASLIFDMPITYNPQVREWIIYYQTEGRGWFKRCLERGFRYMPQIQQTLEDRGLPKDLAYIALIESGFSSQATSSASAVGPWQFIFETGRRYGLKISDWIDERRDFEKSTMAAADYLKFLHAKFDSWYLAAASYNTGEQRIKRLVDKHKSNNFWQISKTGGLMQETQDYVPKLIAAILIAKAPSLYGFRDLDSLPIPATEKYTATGGTDLDQLADHLGVKRETIREMNPELVKGYIPRHISSHTIRIPKGAKHLMASFYSSSLAFSK